VPEGREVIERMIDLVESVKFIGDKDPPEAFERYWSRMTAFACLPCKWARLRLIYERIVANGFRGHVTMGRRLCHPQVRIVDGTKRTAILVALNRPVPFKWEKVDDGYRKTTGAGSAG
jgi:hypothetical protein